MDERSKPRGQRSAANCTPRASESEGEVEQGYEEYFEGEDNLANEEAAAPVSTGLLEGSPVESSTIKDKEDAGGSHDQLEAFRHQWQAELQQRPGASSREQSPRNNNNSTSQAKPDNLAKDKSAEKTMDIEDEARAYFLQGMDAEDDGSLTEAIYYYRKALQLVPDIESKLGNIFNKSPRDRVRQDSESSMEGHDASEELVVNLDKLKLEEEGLCQIEYEQRMTHISSLPVELLIYILHWIVSNDLDLRSLEMFARVCKGFYMCARDERLWKKAGQKIWGLNLGSAKKYGGSWRRMLLERPHVLYDGCYISKVTYVRQGEQGMDSFYRPYHLVEYFRYIRFFPDGQVLMLVSPEDPMQSLPKLKSRNSKSPGILRGGYRLSEQKVTCLLKRVHTESHTNVYRYKRQQRQANNQSDVETCYVVECEVTSSGRRAHAQLLWSSYSIRNKSKSTGEEVITEFDLNKRSFPNLIFSRVKSYTSSSSEPLT